MYRWHHECMWIYQNTVSRSLAQVEYSSMITIQSTLSKKKTQEFLKKEKAKTMTWPSMSPELNPIEHLWGILKKKVEYHNPSSKEQLTKIVSEEWQNIFPEICPTLVSYMLRRSKSSKIKVDMKLNFIQIKRFESQ